MTTSDPKAPANTVIRGCRIASIAAIKNVLSPISEKMIIAKDRARPSKLPSWLRSIAGSAIGRRRENQWGDEVVVV